MEDASTDVVVIGAGQAGLSTSYHLRRLGVEHVVLDADERPGGAWQHRWDSLTMADVHGVAALPDAARPERGNSPASPRAEEEHPPCARRLSPSSPSPAWPR